MFTKKFLGLTCLSLMLLGVNGVARASLIYELNTTQVGAFGSGPYGSVTLTQNGVDVDVTVDLRSDLNFVNTPQHSVFSFNPVDVISTDITNVLFNGSANADYTIVTPGINQPFGNFTFMIDCTGSGCANGAPGQQFDPLTFTVLNALEMDLVGWSSGGEIDAVFAADVICVEGSCNGATGAIGAVPVPAAVWLFGSGLLGLIGVARRKKA